MDGARKNAHIIDRTGQQWGQYRIISSLEQGRFSRAYLGEHISTSKQYVIDILPVPLTREQIDIFLRQARAMTQLSHQHILHLADAGVENSQPFIVLDYVSHIPLRQQYQQGSGQSLDKLLPYLKQAVAALQYAHDKGILHKNLRPETVLLGWSSGTLVSDFAIDVIAQNEHYQNSQRAKDPIDAMAYTAPELIQRQASPASDQYALGIMVYEWLSGGVPFKGSYFELANQQRSASPLPLSQVAPDVSSEVDKVVMTALSKDPTRRFGSVTAFINALEQAHNPGANVAVPSSRQGQAAELRMVPPPVNVPPPAAPPTARTAVSSVPAAPTMAPSNYTTQPSMQAPPPSPVPVSYGRPEMLGIAGPTSPAHPPVQPPIPVTPQTPEPLAPRRDPKQATRRALFVAVAALAVVGGGGGWLLLQKTQGKSSPTASPTPVPPEQTFTPGDTGAPKMVYTAHKGRVNGLCWSPDGTKIASASDDKTVMICDLKQNTLLTYPGHKARVNAVVWSPDGTTIASASDDKTVQVWNAADGKLLLTYTKHQGPVTCLSWSADGRFLASGGADRMVHAWSVDTGEVFFFYGSNKEFTNQISAVAWSPNGSRLAATSWDKTMQVIAAAPDKGKNILIGDTIVKYRHQDEVYALAWSPDGEIIASGGAGHAVLFCSSFDGSDVLIGGKKLEPRPHLASIRSIAWSPDINFLASSDDNKEVRVWDIRVVKSPDQTVRTFKNHTDAVYAIAWAPVAGSNLIASGGADRSVQVWDAKAR